MKFKLLKLLNIKKTVAVATTLCFLFTMVFSQTLSAAITPAPVTAINQSAFKSIENYLLPFSVGRVTDALYTGGDEVVINIQDLHSHAQAQRNISNILNILDKKYGLKNVYVEGGIGQVDTSWLSSISDEKLKETILNNMLESGRLTGGEYYSVETNKNKLLLGIEDKTTYINNLKRLNEIYSKKQEILKYISFLKYTLNEISKKYYSTDNLKLNRIIAKYKAGNLSAEKYFTYLLKAAKKANINLRKYPAIIAFLQVLKKQDGLDTKKVNLAIAELLNDLKTQLSYEQYQALLSKVSDKNKETEFYFDLYKVAKEKGLLQNSNYRTITLFFEYLSLNQSLNPVDLTMNEKNILQELNIKLSQNQNEKDIYFLHNYLEYFSGYLTNKLTADEYEYFINNMARFKLLWKKYVDINGIIELDYYLNLFNDFYKDNVERNRFFIKNIIGQMPNQPKEGIRIKANLAHAQKVLDQLSKTKKVKVVITGGFHTYGFTKLLQDENINYIVITPNVKQQTVSADVLYENIFKEQVSALYNTLQKMLASQISGPEKVLNRDVIDALNSNPDMAKNILNRLLETSEIKEQVESLEFQKDGKEVLIFLKDKPEPISISLDKDFSLTPEQEAIIEQGEFKNEFEIFSQLTDIHREIREIKRKIYADNADVTEIENVQKKFEEIKENKDIAARYGNEVNELAYQMDDIQIFKGTNEGSLTGEQISQLKQDVKDINTYITNRESLSSNKLKEIKNKIEQAQTKIYFGTAGHRGKMPADFNPYIAFVIAACSAKTIKDKNLTEKVFISYDSRYMGKEYAQIMSLTFRALGIDVDITDIPTATPSISNWAKENKIYGMTFNVTASHNPPLYNGIKPNNNDGSPALPEVTTKIQENAQKESLISYLENNIKTSIKEANVIGMSDKGNGLNEVQDSHFENVKEVFAKALGVEVKDLENILEGLNIAVDFKNSALEPEMLAMFKFLGINLAGSVNSGRDVIFGGKVNPEPNEDNTGDLKDEVKKLAKTNSNVFGIATDPDGDRFNIYYVTKNGNVKFLSPDKAGMIVQKIFLEKKLNKLDKFLENENLSEEEIAEFLDKNNYNIVTVRSADTTSQIDKLAEKYEEQMKNSLQKYSEEHKGRIKDIEALKSKITVSVEITDIGFKNLAEMAKKLEDKKIIPLILMLLESSGGLVSGLYDKDGLTATLLPLLLLKNENTNVEDELDKIEAIVENSELLDRDAVVFEDNEELNISADEQKDNFLSVTKNFEKICKNIEEFTNYLSNNNIDIKDVKFSPDTNIENGVEIQFPNGNSLIVRASGTETKIRIYTKVNAVRGNKKQDELDEELKIKNAALMQLGNDLVKNSGNGEYAKYISKTETEAEQKEQSAKEQKIEQFEEFEMFEQIRQPQVKQKPGLLTRIVDWFKNKFSPIQKGQLQLTTIKDKNNNDVLHFNVNENLIEDEGFDKLKKDNPNVVKNPFENLNFEQAAEDIKNKDFTIFYDENNSNIVDAQAFVALSGNANNIKFTKTKTDNCIDVTGDNFNAERVLAIAVLLSVNGSKKEANNLIKEISNLINRDGFKNISYQALYASEVSGTNVEKFNAYFPGADGLRNYLFKTFPNRNPVVTEGPQLQHSIGQAIMAAVKSFFTYTKSKYSSKQYNQFSLPWYIIPMENQITAGIGTGHLEEYTVNKNNNGIGLYPVERNAQSAAVMMALFSSVGQAQQKKTKTKRTKTEIDNHVKNNSYANEINKHVKDEKVDSEIKYKDGYDGVKITVKTKSTLDVNGAVKSIKGIKNKNYQVNGKAWTLSDFYKALNGGSRVNMDEDYNKKTGRPANHHVLEYCKFNGTNFEIIANNKLTTEQNKMLEEHVKTLNRMLNLLKEWDKQGIETVIFNGIGGSELGPRMIVEFLELAGIKNIKNIRFISSPSDIDNVKNGLKPETTAIVGMSKSGTTLETKTNMRSLLEWKFDGVNQKNKEDINKAISQIAYVSDKDYAIKLSLCIALGIGEEQNIESIEKESDENKKILDEFLSKKGVDYNAYKNTNKFGFDDSIGGRWSWISAIGMAVLAYKPEAFSGIVEGARNLSLNENGNYNDISLALSALNIKATEIDGNEIQYIKFTIDGKDKIVSLPQFVEWYKQLLEESNGKGEDISGNLLDKISSCQSVEYNDGSIEEQKPDVNIIIAPEGTAKVDNEIETNIIVEYDGTEKGMYNAFGKLLNVYEKQVEAEGFMRGVNSYNQPAVQAAKDAANAIFEKMKQGLGNILNPMVKILGNHFNKTQNAQLNLGFGWPTIKEMPMFLVASFIPSTRNRFAEMHRYNYASIWDAYLDFFFGIERNKTPNLKPINMEGIRKGVSRVGNATVISTVLVAAILMFTGSGDVIAHNLINYGILPDDFTINAIKAVIGVISVPFINGLAHKIWNFLHREAKLDLGEKITPEQELKKLKEQLEAIEEDREANYFYPRQRTATTGTYIEYSKNFKNYDYYDEIQKTEKIKARIADLEKQMKADSLLRTFFAPPLVLSYNDKHINEYKEIIRNYNGSDKLYFIDTQIAKMETYADENKEKDIKEGPHYNDIYKFLQGQKVLDSQLDLINNAEKASTIVDYFTDNNPSVEENKRGLKNAFNEFFNEMYNEETEPDQDNVKNLKELSYMIYKNSSKDRQIKSENKLDDLNNNNEIKVFNKLKYIYIFETLEKIRQLKWEHEQAENPNKGINDFNELKNELYVGLKNFFTDNENFPRNSITGVLNLLPEDVVIEINNIFKSLSQKELTRSLIQSEVVDKVGSYDITAAKAELEKYKPELMIAMLKYANEVYDEALNGPNGYNAYKDKPDNYVYAPNKIATTKELLNATKFLLAARGNVNDAMKTTYAKNTDVSNYLKNNKVGPTTESLLAQKAFLEVELYTLENKAKLDIDTINKLEKLVLIKQNILNMYATLNDDEIVGMSKIIENAKGIYDFEWEILSLNKEYDDLFNKLDKNSLITDIKGDIKNINNYIQNVNIAYNSGANLEEAGLGMFHIVEQYSQATGENKEKWKNVLIKAQSYFSSDHLSDDNILELITDLVNNNPEIKKFIEKESGLSNTKEIVEKLLTDKKLQATILNYSVEKPEDSLAEESSYEKYKALVNIIMPLYIQNIISEEPDANNISGKLTTEETEKDERIRELDAYIENEENNLLWRFIKSIYREMLVGRKEFRDIFIFDKSNKFLNKHPIYRWAQANSGNEQADKVKASMEKGVNIVIYGSLAATMMAAIASLIFMGDISPLHSFIVSLISSIFVFLVSGVGIHAGFNVYQQWFGNKKAKLDFGGQTGRDRLFSVLRRQIEILEQQIGLNLNSDKVYYFVYKGETIYDHAESIAESIIETTEKAYEEAVDRYYSIYLYEQVLKNSETKKEVERVHQERFHTVWGLPNFEEIRSDLEEPDSLFDLSNYLGLDIKEIEEILKINGEGEKVLSKKDQIVLFERMKRKELLRISAEKIKFMQSKGFRISHDLAQILKQDKTSDKVYFVYQGETIYDHAESIAESIIEKTEKAYEEAVDKYYSIYLYEQVLKNSETKKEVERFHQKRFHTVYGLPNFEEIRSDLEEPDSLFDLSNYLGLDIKEIEEILKINGEGEKVLSKKDQIVLFERMKRKELLRISAEKIKFMQSKGFRISHDLDQILKQDKTSYNEQVKQLEQQAQTTTFDKNKKLTTEETEKDERIRELDAYIENKENNILLRFGASIVRETLVGIKEFRDIFDKSNKFLNKHPIYRWAQANSGNEQADKVKANMERGVNIVKYGSLAATMMAAIASLIFMGDISPLHSFIVSLINSIVIFLISGVGIHAGFNVYQQWLGNKKAKLNLIDKSIDEEINNLTDEEIKDQKIKKLESEKLGYMHVIVVAGIAFCVGLAIHPSIMAGTIALIAGHVVSIIGVNYFNKRTELEIEKIKNNEIHIEKLRKELKKEERAEYKQVEKETKEQTIKDLKKNLYAQRIGVSFLFSALFSAAFVLVSNMLGFHPTVIVEIFELAFIVALSRYIAQNVIKYPIQDEIEKLENNKKEKEEVKEVKKVKEVNMKDEEVEVEELGQEIEILENKLKKAELEEQIKELQEQLNSYDKLDLGWFKDSKIFKNRPRLRAAFAGITESILLVPVTIADTLQKIKNGELKNNNYIGDAGQWFLNKHPKYAKAVETIENKNIELDNFDETEKNKAIDVLKQYGYTEGTEKKLIEYLFDIVEEKKDISDFTNEKLIEYKNEISKIENDDSISQRIILRDYALAKIEREQSLRIKNEMERGLTTVENVTALAAIAASISSVFAAVFGYSLIDIVMLITGLPFGVNMISHSGWNIFNPGAKLDLNLFGRIKKVLSGLDGNMLEPDYKHVTNSYLKYKEIDNLPIPNENDDKPILNKSEEEMWSSIGVMGETPIAMNYASAKRLKEQQEKNKTDNEDLQNRKLDTGLVDRIFGDRFKEGSIIKELLVGFFELPSIMFDLSMLGDKFLAKHIVYNNAKKILAENPNDKQAKATIKEMKRGVVFVKFTTLISMAIVAGLSVFGIAYMGLPVDLALTLLGVGTTTHAAFNMYQNWKGTPQYKLDLSSNKEAKKSEVEAFKERINDEINSQIDAKIDKLIEEQKKYEKESDKWDAYNGAIKDLKIIQDLPYETKFEEKLEEVAKYNFEVYPETHKPHEHYKYKEGGSNEIGARIIYGPSIEGKGPKKTRIRVEPYSITINGEDVTNELVNEIKEELFLLNKKKEKKAKVSVIEETLQPEGWALRNALVNIYNEHAIETISAESALEELRDENNYKNTDFKNYADMCKKVTELINKSGKKEADVIVKIFNRMLNDKGYTKTDAVNDIYGFLQFEKVKELINIYNDDNASFVERESARSQLNEIKGSVADKDIKKKVAYFKKQGFDISEDDLILELDFSNINIKNLKELKGKELLNAIDENKNQLYDYMSEKTENFSENLKNKIDEFYSDSDMKNKPGYEDYKNFMENTIIPIYIESIIGSRIINYLNKSNNAFRIVKTERYYDDVIDEVLNKEYGKKSIEELITILEIIDRGISRIKEGKLADGFDDRFGKTLKDNNGQKIISRTKALIYAREITEKILADKSMEELTSALESVDLEISNIAQQGKLDEEAGRVTVLNAIRDRIRQKIDKKRIAEGKTSVRKTVRDIDGEKFVGKTIGVLSDLNASYDNKENPTKITDDTRITAAEETLKYVTDRGGNAVVMSHHGRPGGKYKEGESLKLIANEFIERGFDVEFLPMDKNETYSQYLERVQSEIKNTNETGKVFILENIRFDSRYDDATFNEDKNEEERAVFADNIIDLGLDGFVHNGYGVDNKLSNVAVPLIQKMKDSELGVANGLLVDKEHDRIEKIMENPEHPLNVTLGGSKVVEKVVIIPKMLRIMKPGTKDAPGDTMSIGGAQNYTLMVGKARLLKEEAENARKAGDIATAEKLEEQAKYLQIGASRVEKTIKLGKDEKLDKNLEKYIVNEAEKEVLPEYVVLKIEKELENNQMYKNNEQVINGTKLHYSDIRNLLAFDHTVVKQVYKYDEEGKPVLVSGFDIPNNDFVGDNPEVKYDETIIKDREETSDGYVEYVALDIGEKSAEKFAERIGNSKTAFTNGPVGFYENKAFRTGQKTVVGAFLSLIKKGWTALFGGGDAVGSAKIIVVEDDDFDTEQDGLLIAGVSSTGGQTTLAVLEGAPMLSGMDELTRELVSVTTEENVSEQIKTTDDKKTQSEVEVKEKTSKKEPAKVGETAKTTQEQEKQSADGAVSQINQAIDKLDVSKKKKDEYKDIVKDLAKADDKNGSSNIANIQKAIKDGKDLKKLFESIETLDTEGKTLRDYLIGVIGPIARKFANNESLNPFENAEIKALSKEQMENIKDDDEGLNRFNELEKEGLIEFALNGTLCGAFGGLAERLGRPNGPRLTMQPSLVQEKNYLDIQFIDGTNEIMEEAIKVSLENGDKATAEKIKNTRKIVPLMTSEATEPYIVKELESLGYEIDEGESENGLITMIWKEEKGTNYVKKFYLMNQDNVPAISDFNATLAYEEEIGEFIGKGGGHGAFLHLLNKYKILEKMADEENITTISFMQDNIGGVNALLPMVGKLSEDPELDFVITTVAADSEEQTGRIFDINGVIGNVEYNMFDELSNREDMKKIKEIQEKGGDNAKYANAANINLFSIRTDSLIGKKKENGKRVGGAFKKLDELSSIYSPKIKEEQGERVLDEEGNPIMKKPSRKEISVQDIVLLMEKGVALNYDGEFFHSYIFSPGKNSQIVTDDNEENPTFTSKQETTLDVEINAGDNVAKKLELAKKFIKGNVKILGKKRVFDIGGQRELGARIIFNRVGYTLEQLGKHFIGNTEWTNTSDTQFYGDIYFADVKFDGAVNIKAEQGVQITMSGEFKNDGYKLEAMTAEEVNKELKKGKEELKKDNLSDEEEKEIDFRIQQAMRALKQTKEQEFSLSIAAPGNYEVVGNGDMVTVYRIDENGKRIEILTGKQNEAYEIDENGQITKYEQQQVSSTDVFDPAKEQTTEIIEFANEWLQIQSLNIISLFKEKTEIVAVVDMSGENAEKEIAEAKQLAQQGVKVKLVKVGKNNATRETGEIASDTNGKLSFELIEDDSTDNLKIYSYESVDGQDVNVIDNVLEKLKNITNAKKVLYVSKTIKGNVENYEEAGILAYSSESIVSAIAQGLVAYKNKDKALNTVVNYDSMIASYNYDEGINCAIEKATLDSQNISRVMIKVNNESDIEKAKAKANEFNENGINDVIVVLDQNNTYKVVSENEDSKVISYDTARDMLNKGKDIKGTIVYIGSQEQNNLILTVDDMGKLVDEDAGAVLAFDSDVINYMDSENTTENGIKLLGIIKSIFEQSKAKKDRAIKKGIEAVIEDSEDRIGDIKAEDLIKGNKVVISDEQLKKIGITATTPEEKEAVALGIIQALELKKIDAALLENVNVRTSELDKELLTMLGECRILKGESYKESDGKAKIDKITENNKNMPVNEVLNKCRQDYESAKNNDDKVAAISAISGIIDILLTDRLDIASDIENLTDNMDVKNIVALLSAA